MASPAKWTFMVYLGGDNTLSDAGERDLREMAAVGSTDVVNIVAEFDYVGANHLTKRYQVKRGELKEVADLGETDSGDPDFLLDYIAWTKENYPADRYALVLWNVGQGWDPSHIDTISQEVGAKDYGRVESTQHSASPLGHTFFRTTLQTILSLNAAEERAICSDDGSGFWLDTIELGKVLAEAKKLLGQRIDLVGMDGVFNGSLEVAYQVRDYVNHIVTSEEIEPYDGWPYTDVLQKLVNEPDTAPAEFGAHIVEAYVKSYAHTDFTITRATMDLSKVEEVAGALDELADALVAHMPAAQFEIWGASGKPAANFSYHTMWDIRHFCERLEQISESDDVKAASRKVRETLTPGGFIVAEAHQGKKVERCGGVTVYLRPPPGRVSHYYGDLDFACEHRWGKLLEAYHNA